MPMFSTPSIPPTAKKMRNKSKKIKKNQKNQKLAVNVSDLCVIILSWKLSAMMRSQIDYDVPFEILLSELRAAGFALGFFSIWSLEILPPPTHPFFMTMTCLALVVYLLYSLRQNAPDASEAAEQPGRFGPGAMSSIKPFDLINPRPDGCFFYTLFYSVPRR